MAGISPACRILAYPLIVSHERTGGRVVRFQPPPPTAAAPTPGAAPTARRAERMTYRFRPRGSGAAGTGARAARRCPGTAGSRRVGRCPRTARAASRRRSGPRAARARRRGSGGCPARSSDGGRGRGRPRDGPGGPSGGCRCPLWPPVPNYRQTSRPLGRVLRLDLRSVGRRAEEPTQRCVAGSPVRQSCVRPMSASQ